MPWASGKTNLILFFFSQHRCLGKPKNVVQKGGAQSKSPLYHIFFVCFFWSVKQTKKEKSRRPPSNHESAQ